MTEEVEQSAEKKKISAYRKFIFPFLDKKISTWKIFFCERCKMKTV